MCKACMHIMIELASYACMYMNLSMHVCNSVAMWRAVDAAFAKRLCLYRRQGKSQKRKGK